MQKFRDNVTIQGRGGLTPVRNANVTVYNHGTTNKSQIYSNSAKSPKANPFQSDALGAIFFYAENGRYDLFIQGDGQQITLTDILMEDVWEDVAELEVDMVAVEAVAQSAQAVAEAAIPRADLADPTDPAKGAALVGYKPSISGTVGRTQASINSDDLNVLFWTGDNIDGVTSNQDGMEAALVVAQATGRALRWPKKAANYRSTRNLPGFHRVRHVGDGVIQRGDSVWYITPANDDQVNVIHSGPGAAGANDGLSPSEPTTPLEYCRNIWRTWADKVQCGRWEVHIAAGVSRYNGVRSYNLPPFRNPLKVIGLGPSDAVTGWPTSVWEYPGASNVEAFRDDDQSAVKNIEFHNLTFKDWPGSGIFTSGSGHIFTDNVVLTNCGKSSGFAMWVRYGRLTQYGGEVHFTGGDGVTGVGVQYSSMFNIGTAAKPVKFTGCDVGVSNGRGSQGHVEYCDFNNIRSFPIHGEMHTRTRTIRNNFNGFGLAGINLAAGANWDNAADERDTWAGLGPGKQMVRTSTAAFSRPDLTSGRTCHQRANTFYSLPSGAGRTLVSYAVGYTAAFVLLGGALYSDRLIGEATYRLSIQSLQGGTFELAMGASGGSPLVSIAAPVNSTGATQQAVLTFRIHGPQSDSSIARFYAELLISGQPPIIVESTVNVNNEGYRSPDATARQVSLYVTPADNGRAGPTVKNFVSYLEL